MSPKKDKKFIGEAGEEIATRFLMKRGFAVIERNYRKKWGEIDVIAKKDDNIHFIEVKTVSRENLGEERRTGHVDDYRPEDNVHPWKVKRLHRAIETYLLERNVTPETSWQLDLVTVKLNPEKKKAKVKLLEDIVL